MLSPIFRGKMKIKATHFSTTDCFLQRLIIVSSASRQKVRAMTNTLPEAEEEERTAQIRMEESFTIHLGKDYTKLCICNAS